MRTLCSILILLIGLSLSIQAQINDLGAERIQVTKGSVIIKSMCFSPDGMELALATLQGRVKILEPNGLELIREFNLSGFESGARITYSDDGNYLILKKIRAQDWNVNKDNKQSILVIDAHTGKKILRHDGVYDLDVACGAGKYTVLEKGVLKQFSFPEGKLLEKIEDERLGSSICYGPKDELIYASRGFGKGDLKKDPRFKKNRKGLKAYTKYQQTLVGYEVEHLQQASISAENMDEIYDIRTSKSADRILVYAKQDQNVNAILSTNFVLQMGIKDGLLLREQFNSILPDPDFKEHVEADLFGISTNEDMDKSQSIMLYRQSTNEIVARFDIDSRWLEGLKLRSNLDGSASFEFSQDGQLLLVAIGNNIFKWEIQEVE